MPATHAGTFKAGKPKKTDNNIMKTILILIAAASVAALSTSAFSAEKCADCGVCCKAKTKTCTKDCCKK